MDSSSRGITSPFELITLLQAAKTISEASLVWARKPPSGSSTTTPVCFFVELKGSTLTSFTACRSAWKSPPRDRPNSNKEVSVGVPKISHFPYLLTMTSPPVLLNNVCKRSFPEEAGISENKLEALVGRSTSLTFMQMHDYTTVI